MKKQGKTSLSRLTMSEPPKLRKAAGKEDAISKKKTQSKTAQKKKQRSGVDLQREKREPVEQISKKLFESEEETDDIERSSKKKRVNHKTPKAVETSQSDPDSTGQFDVSLDSSAHVDATEVSTAKKSKRGWKKKKQSEETTATSTPDTDRTNGGLESTLDSTLPMEEDDKLRKKGKRKVEKEDVVSFPGTPAVEGQTKKIKGMFVTPAVTEKTPMPVRDEQWLDSSIDDTRKGSAVKKNSQTSRKMSQQKVRKQRGWKQPWKNRRENVKGQQSGYDLKCMNIPRGTRAAYLSLFLSEMDLNPQIKIKKLRQGGGRARTKAIRYAIFTCKTKEERDKLLDLDEILLPSGDTGKENKLRIVPQMSHDDARSNRSVRITNTPNDVTEKDLKGFFAGKKIFMSKAIIYSTDKVAIVFFRGVTDMKQALKCQETSLKGSQMKFVVNKGYMNFDRRGKMIWETQSTA